jgi:hypothetical protein
MHPETLMAMYTRRHAQVFTLPQLIIEKKNSHEEYKEQTVEYTNNAATHKDMDEAFQVFSNHKWPMVLNHENT